ncbi:MAG: hypothetical protein AB7F86_12480 [Bdellovibrionales bacterium]
MINFFRFIFLTLVLCALPVAEAKSCKELLLGFVTWEDEDDDGKLFKGFTSFELRSYDPNSDFKGLLLAESAKVVKPTLEVEFRNKSGKKIRSETFSKTRPFPYKESLAHFYEFETGSFFGGFQEGKIKITLRDGNSEVCSQIIPSHEGD